MRLFGKYRLGFDIWAIILFLAIMIPNFIWFVVPAPNDVLRGESITGTMDTVASIAQAIMIATLCILKNKDAEKKIKKVWVSEISIAVTLYMMSWITYYFGIITPLIIVNLCVAPSIAFILFSISRKNMIACIFALIFTVCHLIYGVINFIL